MCRVREYISLHFCLSNVQSTEHSFHVLGFESVTETVLRLQTEREKKKKEPVYTISRKKIPASGEREEEETTSHHL
jgi:hypothetical protein